jgi:ethanolamine utilization protein EutA
MHDIGFEHRHVTPEERDHLSQVIWAADNVELMTVGIDIGSATSHLMIARVHLQRLSTGLSSRFVVVGREVVWRSPILLTPYRADGLIDADALDSFFRGTVVEAGLGPDAIDTGAVILTGEALRRLNARAIADLFAEQAGRFVCASAGHHLESAMAANGSGAVALSRQHENCILNIDIGGGTTKLALVHRGQVLATAAAVLGARLIAFDDAGRLVRIEGPARQIADDLGLELPRGLILERAARARMVARMAVVIADLIRGRRPEGLAATLMLTDPLPADLPLPDAISFSGGASEYLFGRERQGFNDIGPELMHALAHEIAERGLGAPVWDPGQGIRATVTGAAQFTAQVSGNTIFVSDPEMLPLRNLPVLACNFGAADELDPVEIADAIGSVMIRHDLADGEGSFALAFHWQGDPSHARLDAVAQGVRRALAKTLASGQPVVLMIDGDIGQTLGRLICAEVAPTARIVSLDGVQLREFDYVDIGAILRPANVVTVIIKSLLF